MRTRPHTQNLRPRATFSLLCPSPSQALPGLCGRSPPMLRAGGPASFPHFGPIHGVKRPTKARRVPQRPELPSGLHWGRERAFHQAGRGLTPSISYFPQLKIGSKLLWPRRRGGKGGGRLARAHPPPSPCASHPGLLRVGGQWGRSGDGTISHRTCLMRAGLGAGARAGHEPQLTAPSKAWGMGGAAWVLPSLLGRARGSLCQRPGGQGAHGVKPSPVSHRQGPSGRGAALFLHLLSPWLSTSLMLAPDG